MAKKVLVTLDVKRVTGLDLPLQPSDSANKQYVDSLLGGGGANTLFPFWSSNGDQVCIPTTVGALPFWLTNGVQQNIVLGC